MRVERVGEGHASSAVALARIERRTVAYIADADQRAVVAIDLDTRARLSETPLDASPSGILILHDGRIAVALRDRASVAILQPKSRPEEPLEARCEIDVAEEPIALATTPNDSDLLVTSGWGHALGSYELASMARRFEVSLEREPRGVVVSDDGAHAFVTHAVGSRLSVVDLKADAHPVRLVPLLGHRRNARDDDAAEDEEGRLPQGARRSCQGYALARSIDPPGRLLAPAVFVDPGDPDRRPGGYGDQNTPTEDAAVAVIDESALKPMPASLQLAGDFSWASRGVQTQRPACLLPRAAAVDPGSHTLFVTCLGIDAVVAYDAAASSPALVEKQRWQVGSGPVGIAVDPTNGRAVVWSQFERSLELLSLSDVNAADAPPDAAPRPSARVALGPSKKIPEAQQIGRQLFHSVGDVRISLDGRACASCHPDGRDDALTWATPDGPRRSVSLMGRLGGTAPYAWSGSGTDLNHHLEHTFERLGGQGLRGVERDALVAYIAALVPPLPRAPSGDAKVTRGAAIFRSKEAGCATCHSGAMLSDGRRHDVRSKARADKEGSFDTPSLRFVARRAPYFHDGRFRTLRAVLEETDGEMGHTKQLSKHDVDALEAYLRSL